MKLFNFHAPFTRRQCVFLLLFIVFGIWLYCLMTYSQYRKNTWHGVEARVIEMRGSASRNFQILFYEFAGQPYVAMVSATNNAGQRQSYLRAGMVITVFVNERLPHVPSLEISDVSRIRVTSSVVLILLSLGALYLTSRLMKTLESEATFSQSVSVGDFEHLLEEFGPPSGWSDAFVELLDKQTRCERRTTRASGGSRGSTSSEPTTLA